jgi:hypothetical protein
LGQHSGRNQARANQNQSYAETAFRREVPSGGRTKTNIANLKHSSDSSAQHPANSAAHRGLYLKAENGEFPGEENPWKRSEFLNLGFCS